MPDEVILYGTAPEEDLCVFAPRRAIEAKVKELAAGPRWVGDEPVGALPAQQELWRWLPEPIRRAYGVTTGSPVAGTWVEFSVADMHAIKRELEHAGYEVRCDLELVAKACSDYAAIPRGSHVLNVHETSATDRPPGEASSVLDALASNCTWNASITIDPGDQDTVRTMIAPHPAHHFTSHDEDVRAGLVACHTAATAFDTPRSFRSRREYRVYGDSLQDAMDQAARLAEDLPKDYTWVSKASLANPAVHALLDSIAHAQRHGWFLHISVASNRPKNQACATHIKLPNGHRATCHGWTIAESLVRSLHTLTHSKNR